MDRRPYLARRFADDIYESLADIDVLELEKEEVVDRWVEIILKQFKARSIPFTGRQTVSCRDELVVGAFLAKYPEAVAALEQAREIAWEVFGETLWFKTNLHSDPEGCHICHEGQHVCCEGYYEAKELEGETYSDGSPKFDYDAHMTLEGDFTERLHDLKEGPYVDLREAGKEDLILILVHPWTVDREQPED